MTVAFAEKPEPVAVTVTVGDEGILAGAMYSPVELIVPAVADQLVAPEAVNCWVAPSATVALAGEMECLPVRLAVFWAVKVGRTKNRPAIARRIEVTTAERSFPPKASCICC